MRVGRGGEGGREASSVSDLHCKVVLVAAQERCGCYGNTVGAGAREGGRGWEGLELLHLSTIFRATFIGGGGGGEGESVRVCGGGKMGVGCYM